MPGQHLKGIEVTPDALVHLDRVGCDVAVVRRHGASARSAPCLSICVGVRSFHLLAVFSLSVKGVAKMPVLWLSSDGTVSFSWLVQPCVGP